MEIEIVIPRGMTTRKSVAWGGKAPEEFSSSEEAIRYAVQNSEYCVQLGQWLESRTKLHLLAEFYLSKQRASKSDIDSLLEALFNPLVEGACGPRPAGKPIPQTKDALFWEVIARKLESEEEKTVIKIRPL